MNNVIYVYILITVKRYSVNLCVSRYYRNKKIIYFLPSCNLFRVNELKHFLMCTPVNIFEGVTLHS